MAKVRELRCPNCDYDLRSLAINGEVRCPECGRRGSVRSALDPPWQPLARWLVLALSPGIVTAVFFELSAHVPVALQLPTGIVLVVYMIAAPLYGASELMRGKRPRRYRRMDRAIMLLPLAMIMGIASLTLGAGFLLLAECLRAACSGK